VIRRRFVFVLVALAVCLASFSHIDTVDAQPTAPAGRIGVLTGGTWPNETTREFRQAMREAGYDEGHNLVIEWRPAGGNYDRLPQLALDLIQSKVDVIVVDSTLGTRALKRATSTIPIVMAFVSDPVGSGLVPSLSHPGGNVTGVSMMTTELSLKRLQLFKDALPQLTRVAVLWNPQTPAHNKVVELLASAAPSLSIDIKFVAVKKPEDLGAAFSAIRRAHVQAIDVLEEPMFSTHRATIFRLASASQLPTIYWDRRLASGGLMYSWRA